MPASTMWSGQVLEAAARGPWHVVECCQVWTAMRLHKNDVRLEILRLESSRWEILRLAGWNGPCWPLYNSHHPLNFQSSPHTLHSWRKYWMVAKLRVSVLALALWSWVSESVLEIGSIIICSILMPNELTNSSMVYRRIGLLGVCAMAHVLY